MEGMDDMKASMEVMGAFTEVMEASIKVKVTSMEAYA